MDFTIGADGIERVIGKQHISGYAKRDSYDRLSDYIFNSDNGRVCTLYGLLHTGKRTMIMQAMEDLLAAGKAKEILFISAEEGDHIIDLKKILNEYPDAKYIFIDEATKMVDFQGRASVLADRYAAEEGRRIVLTGTDSLAFKFTMAGELFDRTHVIHTTYIPFREYSRLLDVHDIDDYLKYGGTLTGGNTFFEGNEGDYVRDFEYVDRAIAGNIQYGLEHYDGGDGTFGSLYKFYAHGSLTALIDRLMENDNADFAIDALNKSPARDLGGADTPLTRHNDLIEKVRSALGIKDDILKEVKDRDVAAIHKYLKMLDALHPVDNGHAILTQPGLRYSQIMSILNKVQSAAEIKNNCPADMQDELQKRIEECVLTCLMKDTIFVDLARDKTLSDFKVFKFHSDDVDCEFDVVMAECATNKAYLIEANHSAECLPQSQAGNLLGRETCALVEKTCGVKIVGKAVIYCGDNVNAGNGISYFNAADFLCNPIECVKNMADS